MFMSFRPVHFVTTLKGVTPPLVALDMQAIGFLPLVSASSFQPLLLISTSLTMEDTTSTKKYCTSSMSMQLHLHYKYATFSCAVHKQ